MTMQILLIVNEAPYGSERTYNALRHAISLAKREDTSVRIFFMADAVSAARRGQVTPNGYYNLERMIQMAVRHGAECGACGSCMDARALKDDELTEGVRRSSMEELTAWTVAADKVIVY
jgi:uncharacterized protein involved in oxidation of intracellular sulfur